MVPPAAEPVFGQNSQRLDKWLWFARFAKSRSLAQAWIAAGEVRVNGWPIDKASAPLRPGDEVTVPWGRGWRRVRVVAPGSRRGPAAEAQGLYELLAEGRGEW